MMNELLCKYLSLHEKVTLSTLGTFHKSKYPAGFDKANNAILPPVETLLLHTNEGQKTDSAFLGFVAENLNIPISDAAEKTESFIDKIIFSLQQNKEAAIAGLGTFYQKQNHIHFASDGLPAAAALSAPKVLRPDTVHSLRVGEKEVSSTDMQAFLEQQSYARLTWMYWTIALLLPVFLYLLYRYLQ